MPVAGLANDTKAVLERNHPDDGLDPSGRRWNQRVRGPAFEEIADVAADDGIQRIAGLRADEIETGPCLQIGKSSMHAQASIVGHRTSSFGVWRARIRSTMEFTDRISFMSSSSTRIPNFAFDGDDNLQRIDRVEAEANAEEQTVVRNLVGAAIEVEALDQRFLETVREVPALPGVGARFGERADHQT